MEKKGAGRREEMGALTLEKVAEVSSAIDAAKHVDEVILALHSLAVRLFPVDSSLLAATLDESYRSQVLSVHIPNESERDEWRHIFYRGAAFPTLARILIYNVASKWLACFPFSTQKQIYDSFFVEGPSTEIIQALVPALVQNGANNDFDHNAVCSNVERLLVLCLLEKEGVHHMVAEFGIIYEIDENVDAVLWPDKLILISKVAQLLASIPDKARSKTSSALLSHLFFRQIIIQLLAGAEERAAEFYGRKSDSDITTFDGAIFFVGETISRICRRGSAGILLVQIIPRIISHVQSFLSSNINSMIPDMVKPEFQMWFNVMDAMKNQYAVERLSEELLRQLATKNISDVEAYWILWMLFHRTLQRQIAMRAMFVDKFLLWKVFPVCCLRWIIQFAVLECPPYAGEHVTGAKSKNFLNIIQRLVVTWSKRDFVQSAPIEQQAYITAAVGLCLEKMSKEDLETTKDVLHSILQGVSCRLESPIHLVRKMASSIALVFSRVVDPKNPLYLDDNCCETVDWEFGLISKTKDPSDANHINATGHNESDFSCKEKSLVGSDKRKKGNVDKIIEGNMKTKEFRLADSHGIIDEAMVSSNKFCEEEVNEDENEDFDASSDSSLQPYDLSDDDTDLRKKFSQLADIIVALRKPDDPDGVEQALDVAEKIVRASPDELHHISVDLVKALVHVRCSDATIEGEEDSAEGKRQKALVALLVTCPFESLDIITKLLYSPNVDFSQRILILDVMTEAAQELADAKIIRVKHQHRDLISTISGTHPWFVPTSRGPHGAGPWKEVSETGTSLSWAHSYEREIPSRPGQIKKGKSRRWSLGTVKDSQLEVSKNKFPLYAASFMLPVMEGFDKKRHGVDLLDRDFIVLGKLIYMLGVCMKCITMHPEASALAPKLLDMLRSRQVVHHAEAYVRRSVLFAASCILVALHPSYVAAALIEGNQEISNGLEWIRTWAFQIVESDSDIECSSMAMRCLQLHSELALQTSRSLESADCFRAKAGPLSSKVNDIIIPLSKMEF